MSENITVMFSVSCEIDPKLLKMFNTESGETKAYSDIPEKERCFWVIKSFMDVLDNCEDYDTGFNQIVDDRE